MTTKGPKKPAPPSSRAPRASRASQPARAAATSAAPKKKAAATRATGTKVAAKPKRTLAPAVDVDRELPKIFGGSSRAARESASRTADPEVTRVEKGSSRRVLDASESGSLGSEASEKTDSEPPLSHRAEIMSEAVLDAGVEDAGSARAKPRRPPRTEPASPPPAVVAQIRELEAQLDRLIDEASRRDLAALADDADGDAEDDLEITRDALPPEMERPTPWAAETTPRAGGLGSSPTLPDFSSSDVGSSDLSPAMPPARPEPRLSERDLPLPRRSEVGVDARSGDKAVFDTARELLSTDFYLRKWGRLAMRGRSEEVDDFGFDPIYDQKVRGVLEFLYTRYFRVEQTGIERVPTRGRCLLVANHSGTLPLDGVMIKTAVKLEHPSARDVRWLTEDFIYHMPYLGSAMNRLGAVRACQENAERLLAKEQLVAVFPEGVKGIGKLFAERYRLQRFGRGGFIKLCLRTQTPIVPVAVVGAEETNPMLFRIEYFAKALGVPYVPVTPTFPLLGPAGLLPAPTKWRIHFGEPIDFSNHGPDAADDELLVGKLAERVRATIQGMLDLAIGSRKSVFFG